MVLTGIDGEESTTISVASFRAMTELIDSHVSRSQVERAVKALSCYVRKSRAEEDEKFLLGAKEDFVWLVVVTRKMFPQDSLKPTKMWMLPCSKMLKVWLSMDHFSSLVHPVRDPGSNPVRLLTNYLHRE